MRVGHDGERGASVAHVSIDRRRALVAGISAVLIALVFAVAAAVRDDAAARRWVWGAIALAWVAVAIRSLLRFRSAGRGRHSPRPEPDR